jgi:hypothetical protein
VVPTIVALMLVGFTTESDEEGDTTMVEGQSMTTVADVVAQVRDGRLEDFVREAVVLVARELMESEVVRHEAAVGSGGVRPRRSAVAAAPRS